MIIGEIYSDYDGVLVDFLGHTATITGAAWESFKHPDDKHKRNKMVFENPEFWEHCPTTADYHLLWPVLRKYHPHILTAHPHSMETEISEKLAREGKWRWNEKYTQVPLDKFHVVRREHKQHYATSVDRDGDVVVSNILIDDFEGNIVEWRRNRGIGILHIDAETTLNELKKLGIQ